MAVKPGVRELTEEIGFKKVGQWKMEKTANKPKPERLDPALWRERVLYAFVVEEDGRQSVAYIGACRCRNLENRMRHYRNPSKKGSNQKRDRTNLEIHNRIKKALEEGNEVWIYAWKPPTRKEEFGNVELEIDMVMGLERSLIQKFKPPWNKECKGEGDGE